MKSLLTKCLLLGLLALATNTSFVWAQAQTYVVNTIDDIVNDTDNLLSLREAIAAANATLNDGDIIQFDSALSGQIITLSLGALNIEDDLVIGDDTSPVPITLDGGGLNRIFSVTTASASGTRTVSLYDLSFLNGSDIDGGAIFIGEGEDVNCIRCRFEGNTATGDTPGQGGGAIFTAGDLSLSFTNMLNNTAVTGSGNGGGILIAPTGSLTMTGGSFDSNTANRAGGAVENNGGSASFAGVLFTQNIAGPDSTSAAPGNGGAIHVSGTGKTTIQGGVAVGNIAFSEGGAFWNAIGTMTVDGVTIGGQGTNEANIARGANADNGGGGLFNNGGTLNLINSTVIANMATGASGSGGGILSDGGMLSVSSSQIQWNTSSRAGGGIESTNGAELVLEDVEFTENKTGPAPGNGGAVHVTGSGNTTISGGFATNNRADSEGGAFWNGSGTMTIEGTQVGGTNSVDANVASGPNADNGGGGLFNNGGTLIAKDIAVNWNLADGTAGSGGGILSDGGTLMVSNSVIQGNSSIRAGGGIESTQNASLVLENVNFIENQTGPAPGNGGAVHVTGSGETMIKGGLATGNSAASEGGAFWNGPGTMTIVGTIIGGEGQGNIASGNDADNGGGGVFGINGTLIIKNAWIEDNVADGTSGSGGGVLNDGGMLRMDMTVVKSNKANRAGGGIESNGTPDADGTARATTDSLTFVTLQDNIAGTAPGNGGGFHLTGPGNVAFIQSLAAGNEAGNEGGGLWNSGAGTMQLLNATVSGNSAPKGGGLFQQAGETSSFQLWFATIARNSADTGGGFMSDGGAPMVYNTILAENQADLSGPACSGAFTSSGFNLIESLDGCTLTPASTDITGQPALIMDLADNGGPTATHGLMENSPAIDAGECASVMVDQRGTSRMNPCDIGSFESDGMPGMDSGITFTLIDAQSDTPVAGFDPIPNGANIMRSTLPDELNVRANVPGSPGSVVFRLNDDPAFRTENVAPYALFGDIEGDYRPDLLQDGMQTVTATPYTLPDGMGQMMPAGSITFTVVNSDNAITRFVLVDADSDQDVMVLEDNIIIAASDLPVNLNVRAETGSDTRRVMFAVGENSRTEVIPPFALFGDLSGDYLNGTVPPGSYVLTATPYDDAGREGISMSLRATVTEDGNSPGSINTSGTMWLPADEAVILSNDPSATPSDFLLSENYPNPFNPTTTFSFSVPQASQVQLEVFNVLGQRIRTLINDVVPSGIHEVRFEAGDLPSGIYLYRLETPNGSFVKRMILAK